MQFEYECFFIIADFHTLTIKPQKEHIDGIASNAGEMVLDYLSLGIDPKKSVTYLQSAVHEVYELNLFFEMLVNAPRLYPLPSLKEMGKSADLNEMPFGLLGYPILQAADILLTRAHLVPVGKDNQAHVEITREIAKRFNFMYGEVFPVPEVMVGSVPILIGTDGKAKMFKSLNNAIFLSDYPVTVRKKIFSMYTDPKRIHSDIPGEIKGNPVFIFHDAFNLNRDEVKNLKERYRKGKIGDVEVKEKLAIALNNFLDPVREIRAKYENQKGIVDEIIYDGTIRMRLEARETLKLVKKSDGFDCSVESNK